jgi:hypothetical protein
VDQRGDCVRNRGRRVVRVMGARGAFCLLRVKVDPELVLELFIVGCGAPADVA